MKMILEIKESQEKEEETLVNNYMKSKISTSQRKEPSYNNNHQKIAHMQG